MSKNAATTVFYLSNRSLDVLADMPKQWPDLIITKRTSAKAQSKDPGLFLDALLIVVR